MTPVHPKVAASTRWSVAGSLVLAILNALQDNPGVLAPLPLWAQSLTIFLVPPLLAFLGGWLKVPLAAQRGLAARRGRRAGTDPAYCPVCQGPCRDESGGLDVV